MDLGRLFLNDASSISSTKSPLDEAKPEAQTTLQTSLGTGMRTIVSARSRCRAAAVPEDGRKAVDKFRLMFKPEKMSAADVSR